MMQMHTHGDAEMMANVWGRKARTTLKHEVLKLNHKKKDRHTAWSLVFILQAKTNKVTKAEISKLELAAAR